jgi:phosphatidylinositol alpha-mannosyltransferase
LFAECDIIARMSSRQQNQGLAAVEAMATGVAAIVSSNTGVRSPEEDGAAGRAYRSRDPGHMASALRKLIADPNRRAMLRTAGAESALKHGQDVFVANLERAMAVIGRG